MLPVFVMHKLKITAITFNSLFALISIFSSLIAIFSWFSPPAAGISPSRVADHPQYSFAVFFVGITSAAIFLLSIFGIVSLILCNSFFMFLHIVMLLVQISVQLGLSAFALANQQKIHATVISQWRSRSEASLSNDDCGGDAVCSSHLELLRQVERIIFIVLLVFFSLQVLLLLISCCYCNYISEREQYEAVEKDNAESN